MPVILRIVLIISSVLMLIYMLKKVKKSKVQIEHTIFWIILGVFLILISLVPQIIYLFAYLLGIQSPVNLILAFIIFVLLIKQFLMTIEVSQLEIKIRELVEEIALKEKNDEESYIYWLFENLWRTFEGGYDERKAYFCDMCI